jgi:hypothetical protein
MDNDDDPKAKDVIAQGTALPLDLATQRELERWFGLPSFVELAEQGRVAAPPMDPEMAEVIERRDRALAAVDPALLDEIRLRTDDVAPIMVFTPNIDVMIDENVALFDHGMVDRAITIAEPREVEIPDALIDELKECTPQALLRDLHRPELYFDKQFEIVDVAAEQRLDIVAEVRSAMATSWKLPAFGRTPVAESRELIDGVRSDRRRPWTDVLPHLPNRTVTE